MVLMNYLHNLTRKIVPAAGIFLAVGILIGSWAASGTVALLVVVGLDLILPAYFLPTAAAASALIAFTTGTSWGTISTIGVALMGVARGMGLPLPAAAGAIVAGAHFGDKLSPLSETATLASTVAGANLYDHIRHMIYTTVPAFLISLALYAWLGSGSAPPPDMGGSVSLKAALTGNFNLHPLLWTPPLVVLAAAVFRAPVVPSMLVSAALALVLGVSLQGLDPAGIPSLILFGYRPTTGHAEADQLLAQGGLWPMIQLAIVAGLLFLAVDLGLRSAWAQKRLGSLTARLRTPASLVAAALGVGLILIFTSGSSYLAIILTGDLLAAGFRRSGLAPQNLSRTLEDTGTVVAPLVPWGVSGLFMTRTLGVSTWDYAPYAAMNYLGIGFALLYALTGWTITKSSRQENRE